MPVFNQPDWLTRNITTWEYYVIPVVKQLQSASPISWLEIGSCEGRSALWVYKRIIRPDIDELICVDIWKWPAVEKTFDNNIAGTQIVKHKETSFDYLRKTEKKFHVAYIDGSHDAPRVLEDAALTYRRIVPGGIIIFDDYGWEQSRATIPTQLPPRPAIDAFLDVNILSLRVLCKGWQVIVQKLTSA